MKKLKLFAFTFLCLLLVSQNNSAVHAQQTDTTLGTIAVCQILLDQNGNIVNGNGLDQTNFTLAGLLPDNPLNLPGATSLIPRTTFSTPLSLNAKLLSTSKSNDAMCVTYSVPVGTYYYQIESNSNPSEWTTNLVDDEIIGGISPLSEFSSYDGSLYNQTTSLRTDRNINSDGEMILLPQYPHRILALLSQASKVSPTTTQNQPISITQSATTNTSTVSGNTYILASKTVETTIAPIKKSNTSTTVTKRTVTPSNVQTSSTVQKVVSGVSTSTKNMVKNVIHSDSFHFTPQNIVLLISFAILLLFVSILIRYLVITK